MALAAGKLRRIFSELATKLMACASGLGIAQTVEFGIEPLIARGEVVQVLSDWAEERFPLYAYYPSRQMPPLRVRAFIDFLLGCFVRRPAQENRGPARAKPSRGGGA